MCWVLGSTPTLTGALGHTDGAVLVLGARVALQLKGELVVDERLGALRHAGARVVEVPAGLEGGNT